MNGERAVRAIVSFCVFVPSLLWSLAASAASFEIVPQGEGFGDRAPRTQVAGNTATTLGAQRLAAVRYAAERWAKLLDSDVPVVVQVRFADLGCRADAVILAHAGAVKMLRGIEGDDIDPALWFPSALANRLSGVDLSPGEPDILMEINSAVDAACRGTSGGWYYGFDGAGGGAVDLVETVMHELAHGLGFSSSIDPETGEPGLPVGTDVFSSRIRDTRTGSPWVTLSAADRRFSTRSPRSLVFEGMRTQKRALAGLNSGADAAGRPYLFTNVPVDRGSSVSHFDPLARPDLLMEPFARRVPTHDVDLTLMVLADLGWSGDEATPSAGSGARGGRCGDGLIDPVEQCDDGEDNDDRASNACRTSCRAPRCGDGVVDRGEACDSGAGCSDRCTRSPVAESATTSAPWDAGVAPTPVFRRERGGCDLGGGADRAGSGLLVLALAGLLARRRARAT